MVYVYKCNACGHVFDGVSSVSHRNDAKGCPECSGEAGRSFCDELRYKSRVDATMIENERWSWSMGVHVNDIPEMNRKYPDREYHPRTGQLLIKHRQHKKQLMRENDYEEYS